MPPSAFFFAATREPGGLGFPVLLVVCALVFFAAVRRAVVTRRLTLPVFATAVAACAAPLGVVFMSLFPPPIDLTPDVGGIAQVAGEYAGPTRTITLLADGTYTTTGFEADSGGSWTHDGWKLTLEGSPFKNARFVTQGGATLIAPYYDSEFERLGPTLKRR